MGLDDGQVLALSANMDILGNHNAGFGMDPFRQFDDHQFFTVDLIQGRLDCGK
jgi:hypothetical protein